MLLRGYEGDIQLSKALELIEKKDKTYKLKVLDEPHMSKEKTLPHNIDKKN